jgi:hypothetical protein
MHSLHGWGLRCFWIKDVIKPQIPPRAKSTKRTKMTPRIRGHRAQRALAFSDARTTKKAPTIGPKSVPMPSS